MDNKLVSGVLVVAVLGLLGVSAFKNTTVTVNNPQPQFGAQSGPESFQKMFFRDNAVIGGNVLATSSQGTATYTSADITNSKVITHTATAALTVTLPASSTLTNFVPNVGDTAEVFINPVTTLITFAGGTGTELNTASSTKNVNAGGLGVFKFVRKANTDIEVFMSAGI